MLNKVILMGRLTADPELKRTGTDRSVTSFSLAVERSYAPKGEKRQTDFLDCVAWGNTADFICKWFSKGLQVAVTGRLQARQWEDKQGNKRRSTEVIVDEAFFADSKRDGNKTGQRQEQGVDLPFDLGDEYSDLDDDAEFPY